MKLAIFTLNENGFIDHDKLAVSASKGYMPIGGEVTCIG